MCLRGRFELLVFLALVRGTFTFLCLILREDETSRSNRGRGDLSRYLYHLRRRRRRRRSGSRCKGSYVGGSRWERKEESPSSFTSLLVSFHGPFLSRRRRRIRLFWGDGVCPKKGIPGTLAGFSGLKRIVLLLFQKSK